jgi:beta-galactosidase
VLPNDLAERLRQYVANGGNLIVGFRSGVKDATNRVVERPLPGALSDVLGIEVEEYDALYDQPQSIRFLVGEPGFTTACELWADILKPNQQPEPAVPLAEYTQDYYAGRAAITMNRYQQGSAVYIGVGLPVEILGRMLVGLAYRCGIVPPVIAPLGVEVTRRKNGNETWWFFLNHTAEIQSVTLPGAFVDAWNGLPVGEQIKLEAYGVRVLKDSGELR